MSSINSNDDDEYLNYDKELNQNSTANVIQDVITTLDDDDDDDTMETIIRTPEYNESSRMMMMMMMTDGVGFVDSSKKEDYCYINPNPNPNPNTNNNSNYKNNYNCNYNSNYNCNYNFDNNYTNNNTNIISYECSSLFEDYDDVMFPSDTIITVY